MALLQSFKRQLGFVKESSFNSPAPATSFVPFTSPPKFEDVPTMVKDPGGRGTRAMDQGIYQGIIQSTGTFETFWYPTLGPHFIMGVLGTDIVSGPAAKTGTIGAASAGATTLTYTVVTGGAPLSGETYMLDSGLATEEAVIPTVTGAGPYTFTVAATKYTHLASATASSMWSHALSLGNTVPSYCYSDYYGNATPPVEVQYGGMFYEKVSLKWTAAGEFKITPALRGCGSTTTTQPSAVYTTNLPLMAWQAVLTLNNSLNPRLVTWDLDFTQPVGLQYGANGLQSPNAGTAGALTVDGKMSFAIQDDTERNFFRTNQQVPATIVFTSGAKSVTFQMSKLALMPSTAIDTAGTYALLQASYSAVYNTSDSGPIVVTEKDPQSASY